MPPAGPCSPPAAPPLDVGQLARFKSIPRAAILPTLMLNQKYLEEVPPRFVDLLQHGGLIEVMEARVDLAMSQSGGGDQSVWSRLCETPLDYVMHQWKEGGPFNDQSVFSTFSPLQTSQALLLYHCLYTILFYRHSRAFARYAGSVVAFQDFVQQYSGDGKMTKKGMGRGAKGDSWEANFRYRNVLVLAACVKPTKRNKCMFSKIGCLLAEGRIHTLGGGQSFTAHRRCHVFTREFNTHSAVSETDLESEPAAPPKRIKAKAKAATAQRRKGPKSPSVSPAAKAARRSACSPVSITNPSAPAPAPVAAPSAPTATPLARVPTPALAPLALDPDMAPLLDDFFAPPPHGEQGVGVGMGMDMEVQQHVDQYQYQYQYQYEDAARGRDAAAKPPGAQEPQDSPQGVVDMFPLHAAQAQAQVQAQAQAQAVVVAAAPAQVHEHWLGEEHWPLPQGPEAGLQLVAAFDPHADFFPW